VRDAAGSVALVTGATGLTAAEVAQRVQAGQVNVADERTSRTYAEIVRANVLTRFNAILASLFVLILIFGEGQDALFGFVLVFNTLIGIVQEIRAKRTLDRLAVLAAPKARVVRDGEVHDVAVTDVVLDDLCEVRAGDQLPADGVLQDANGLEVDESLLTGESDPDEKRAGDEVLSGSIVVAGSGRFVATHVGADAYARKLATEARRFQLVHSELVDGINTILKYVQWLLIPTAALLAFSQFSQHHGFHQSIAATVAGVVAMVPEGLVLLTSIAFGLAAVTLARRRVLVQELPAIEGLARVDTVLLDKTGTITEGAITFDRVHEIVPDDPVAAALGALASDEVRNATMNALCDAFPPPDGWERTASVPFSSARKWSAAAFAEQGTWVLGAPEIVWENSDGDGVRAQANELAAQGQRVLLLARTDAEPVDEQLPPRLAASALVVFEEQIRAEAPATLAYFASEGVRCRVISGDNPETVAAVARRVGLPDADEALDARTLPDDLDALAETLETTVVFGRVTPEQKRSIVRALQQRGHVVAMTGDGVNDALALKDADIGIAMGNGAPATRAVAQIVLLDSEFAAMPGVVAEGRRVIANIERVANLFVTKTCYATLLALAIGVARWQYPFLPRHMTIVSSLTIGIPAFFLALASNSRRYVPGFIPRVMRFAVPAGTIAAIATMTSYAIAHYADGVSIVEARTLATVTLVLVGLWVLNLQARPITRWRALLFAAMVGAFATILAVPRLRHFFALDIPWGAPTVAAFVIAAIAGIVLEVWWRMRGSEIPRGEPQPAVGVTRRA
jgi:cation-transporting ATPase E